jgi:hypothetical protein
MELDSSKPDLYVCEPSSSISDQSISKRSVEQSSSSSGFCLSSSSTTPLDENYTREKVQYFLKHNKTQYVVLDNSSNKNSSICWRLFGFPAKLDMNGVPQKIKNFVSCKICFTTYCYISNSTSFLNKHSCESAVQKPKFTSSSSSSHGYSQSLITAYGHPKTVRLPDSHSKEMKDLVARWICKDMRPFAIVDDVGFREIAQRCVSIGNFIFY